MLTDEGNRSSMATVTFCEMADDESAGFVTGEADVTGGEGAAGCCANEMMERKTTSNPVAGNVFFISVPHLLSENPIKLSRFLWTDVLSATLLSTQTKANFTSCKPNSAEAKKGYAA
jgi:hypothetical protein